jgi:hypothetical protein
VVGLTMNHPNSVVVPSEVTITGEVVTKLVVVVQVDSSTGNLV